MDLMSNMSEYQTKETPGRVMWEHYQTISPEKHDSSREEKMSSLPEGEWVVAESQSNMTQDKVKFVCQGATLWIKEIFMRGRVELFKRVERKRWAGPVRQAGLPKWDLTFLKKLL